MTMPRHTDGVHNVANAIAGDAVHKFVAEEVLHSLNAADFLFMMHRLSYVSSSSAGVATGWRVEQCPD